MRRLDSSISSKHNARRQGHTGKKPLDSVSHGGALVMVRGG